MLKNMFQKKLKNFIKKCEISQKMQSKNIIKIDSGSPKKYFSLIEIHFKTPEKIDISSKFHGLRVFHIHGVPFDLSLRFSV